MVQVSLQVQHVDLADDAALDCIGEHLADLMWEETGGLVVATLFCDEGANAVGAAVQAARQIEAHLPHAKVKRVHRELVNASEIAARAGVSRQAVSKWVNRAGAQPFPEAANVLAGERSSRLWLWPDVSRWLRDTYALDTGERFPSDAEVAEIDAHLERGKSYTDWRTQWGKHLDAGHRAPADVSDLSAGGIKVTYFVETARVTHSAKMWEWDRRRVHEVVRSGNA